MADLLRWSTLVGLLVVVAGQAPRPVFTSAATYNGADIVFILDGSGSVTKFRFQNHFVTFMTDIAEQLSLGRNAYQIAVVQFGNKGKIEIALNAFYDVRDFRRNASLIPFMDENTNTTGGILETIEIFSSDKYGARGGDWAKIGILLTDGVATYDKHRLNSASLSAKSLGITLLPVGIGSRVDEAELLSIAQTPDTVETVPTFDDLLEATFIDQVVERVKGIVASGTVHSDLRLKEAADVVFILDASESVTETSFNENVLQLVTDVTTQLTLGQDSYQVGVITYGNMASLSLRLREEYNAMDIRSSIAASISYRNDMTNTSGAIKTLRTLVSSPDWRSSGREQVPVVGVLITDGHSTVEPAMMLPEAMRAKAEGVKLLVVAVGEDRDLDIELLTAAASEPATQHFMTAAYFDELQEADMAASLLSKIQNIAQEALSEFEEWSCDFEDADDDEDGFCGMEQSQVDDFDWTRLNQRTPSFDTGPYGAKNNDYFIYIESSGRYMEKAVISLPKLESPGSHCVSFFYNMYGHHINKLVLVKQSPSSGREQLWQKAKTPGSVFWESSRWYELELDVTLEMEDQLAFEGYTGAAHTGDIALDLITVKKGNCSE